MKTYNADKYKIKNIIDYISSTISEILMESIDDRGLSQSEYEKKQVRKEKLNQAQLNCGLGDLRAKEYMKSFIADLLLKAYGIDNTTIDHIICFNNNNALNIQDKFEILLYYYKKSYKYNALTNIIKKYNLANLKNVQGENLYIITKEEIEEIFDNENIKLNFEDKLSIVTQRVYENYKGLGVIDEIRDMKIEGVSGGVNGIPEFYISKTSDTKNFNAPKVPKSYDSIWILYDTKSVHLDFLSFGSYAELERICNIIYKYRDPGQLSQSKGYIYNSMADGSRVLVKRPPFCEAWIFFIRKHDLDDYSLQQCISGENSEMVVVLLDFLVKSCMTMSVTGMQYAGKTTLIIAMLKSMYGFYNLRIWENFFEAYLRRILPNRNIDTVQSTPEIAGDEGLDVLKKSDGDITIVQEVAEDKTAAYMIKVAQAASICTIFGHHAKTFNALIKSLRNSLLNIGLFSNEKIAEEQVLSMLDFDIHLNRTIEGKKRYIERLTECVETNNGYKDINIVEYDIDNDKYVIKNSISIERLNKINAGLLNEDKQRFKDFVKKRFNEEI